MKQIPGSGHRLAAGLVVTGAMVLIVATGSEAARAATETYSIDASHSNVGFSITHFFARVPGRFTGIEGTISLDPADLGTGSVRVVIDAATIDTANEDRDTHLRSADFFDVANHPRITFESTGVRSSGNNRAMVDGILTMRGVSRQVTLEVEFLGSGPDAWGGHRSGFEARATIDRKDFGLIWNKVLDSGGVVLGDEVSILIDIEGIRQEPPAAEEPRDAEAAEPAPQ